MEGPTASERERFEDLARTLGLADAELGVSATIRPGTLAVTPSRAPSAPIGATTLPRLALGEGTASGEAEYEKVSLLGEGGMGSVWLARQRSLRREVAVKRLRRSSWETADVAALVTEARVTGLLAHPGVVPVHALGVDTDGSPLLVMKPIEGASFDTLLRTPDHPTWADLERRHGDRLAARVQILMQVADALHFAHSRGVVHRDVKPENVMVGAYGEVYLVDWGIALARDVDADAAGRGIVGTPIFMAPEMIDERPDRIDARTDVYLLGATLHAALTGAPRHAGRTIPEVLLAAFASEPVAYGPEVPAELAALANRATARDPAERPGSALEVREALSAFLRHRASIRLAESAAASLAALGTEPTAAVLVGADAARRLGEARFGFAQALREWPENDPARAGLRRVLVLSVEAELERRSVAGASALADELEPRDPGLDARIAALRAELAESDRLASSARRDLVERDPRLARRERGWFLAVLLTITALVTIGTIWTSLEVGRFPSIDLVFAGDAAAFGFLALLAFAYRRRLAPNLWGRTAVGLVLLGVGARALSDLVALLRGDPTEAMAPYGILVLAAAIGGGALALTPRLWPPAAVGMAGAVLSARWSAVAVPAMVGTIVYATTVLLRTASSSATHASDRSGPGP